VRAYPRFPSLLITAGGAEGEEGGEEGGGLTPQGAFAEAQAAFLEPKAAEVSDAGEVPLGSPLMILAR